MIQFDKYFSNGLKPPTSLDLLSVFFFQEFWLVQLNPSMGISSSRLWEDVIRSSAYLPLSSGTSSKNSFQPQVCCHWFWYIYIYICIYFDVDFLHPGASETEDRLVQSCASCAFCQLKRVPLFAPGWTRGTGSTQHLWPWKEQHSALANAKVWVQPSNLPKKWENDIITYQRQTEKISNISCAA